MAVSGKIYPLGIVRAYKGMIDVSDHDIKCMLLSSSYNPNLQTDQALNAVENYEVSGTGYTTGGAIISDLMVGLKSGTSIMQFWFSDISWLNSTISARYAVVYDSNTEILIAFVDFGQTMMSVNGLFKIDPDNTEGLFQISVE